MIAQLAGLLALCLSASIPTPDYYDYSANYVYNDDPAFKLTAVCDGYGTNIVRCQWIPLLEELRTPEERILANWD